MNTLRDYGLLFGVCISFVAVIIMMVMMIRILRTTEPEIGIRFFVFELKLWGDTARVAAVNADAAWRVIAENHPFGAAWSNAVVSNLGWDIDPGSWWRFKRGGGVISIVSAPRAETPPVPEKALLSGAADDRPRDLERD